MYATRPSSRMVAGVRLCAHALGLLRARSERPGDRRAAEQRDELAALHSITSSAMLSSDAGTVRPNILAVEALMTNSTLVDTHPSGSLRSSLRLRISNH